MSKAESTESPSKENDDNENNDNNTNSDDNNDNNTNDNIENNETKVESKNDDNNGPKIIPSVKTGDSESGTSSDDYDTESYSEDDNYGDEENGPPNLSRPKTPAHTLRNMEAEQWTHDELDEMQSGMMQELSRLLSTANLNDPMLDQLNIAVMTPRVHSSNPSHHKTSTMDSIFSFMSNDSDNKEDRSLQFYAMDPSEIDNVPSKVGGPNNNNNNVNSIGNNSNNSANNNMKMPEKGTNDYQNRAKMEVDKTIENISSSVDEVISKLEKDKTGFSKKTKDKNGKKTLSKKNKDILDKLTLYQESLMKIHDSLEDFEKMIDEFEMDTVLHKQTFEYNIKKHYETKYETERQIMELELKNLQSNVNSANNTVVEDWKEKERVKYDLKLKEEMKLYKKSIKEQYRVRIKNLQKRLKLNEDKKRKEYKEKIMESFEVIVRERIRKMEEEKKLKAKLLQKQKTQDKLKLEKKEKAHKEKVAKKEKKERAKKLKEKSKQYR